MTRNTRRTGKLQIYNAEYIAAQAKKPAFKVGERVRNKTSGEVGTIMIVQLVGMRDCVVVQYRPCSDGLCTLKTNLEKA